MCWVRCGLSLVLKINPLWWYSGLLTPWGIGVIYYIEVDKGLEQWRSRYWGPWGVLLWYRSVCSLPRCCNGHHGSLHWSNRPTLTFRPGMSLRINMKEIKFVWGWWDHYWSHFSWCLTKYNFIDLFFGFGPQPKVDSHQRNIPSHNKKTHWQSKNINIIYNIYTQYGLSL